MTNQTKRIDRGRGHSYVLDGNKCDGVSDAGEYADATHQLTDEISTIGWNLAQLIGLDIDDTIVTRARARTPGLVAQQDTDDHLAAETAADVMRLLWPTALPEESGRPDWWQTPLGRLCARALARDDSDAITYATAAAMLGVQRGTVSVWVQRGTLARHPDGGVVRASVMERLAR